LGHTPSVAANMDRRRSERLSHSLPLVIRGTDLLGQPFEERTSTTNLNLHGLRFASRHHLPKNTWVTIGAEPLAFEGRAESRARVVWIERPRSIRDYFQIALELESPANLWSLDAPPNWAVAQAMPEYSPESEADIPARVESFLEPQEPIPFSQAAQPMIDNFSNPQGFPAPMQSYVESSPEVFAPQPPAGFAVEPPFGPSFDSAMAPDPGYSGQEFVSQGAPQFTPADPLPQPFEPAPDFATQEIPQPAVSAGFESAAASTDFAPQEAMPFVAPFGAEEPATEPAAASPDVDFAEWREHLRTSIADARAEWNELLQSSLDSGVSRIAEQVAARAHAVRQDAEAVIADRSASLRLPLEEITAEARAALAAIKIELDQEVAMARASLAEIEQLAARLRDHSIHLEAVNRDTLDQVGQRLSQIVEGHAAALDRHADSLASDASERIAPALETLCNEFVSRAVRAVETELAPRFERIPELLRELETREMQSEESLRLYRERLRQSSEYHLREMQPEIAEQASALREMLDAARADSLGKHQEDLETASAHAAQAASESLGRTSEWFEQEARGRFQTLSEQALGSASSAFDERIAGATQDFESRLQEAGARHISEAQQRADEAAGETLERTRTQLDQAAEAAAASFGEVLRGISNREAEQFAFMTQANVQDRERELRDIAQRLQGEMENAGNVVSDQVKSRLASQVELSAAAGRSALAFELDAAREQHRAAAEELQRQWAENLQRLSEETLAKHQERLETATDSWVVSSVRRLNEHGQNVIESLMRSADNALRDSWSRILEGLAANLREREAGLGNAASIPPMHESGEPNASPQ
jgi:hypothetical protein